MKYTLFQVKMGWMGVLAGDRGLLRTTLPRKSREEALSKLGEKVKEADFSPRHFNDLSRRFIRYFEGHEVFFSDEIDVSVGTSFQRSVWKVTSLIPYGEARSYAWVAEGLGDRKAARAAGQALHKNPLPIVVPCHRVLGCDGSLTGFGGGLPMKRALLRLERVKI